jgi:serine/threonine-protein phosphatase 2A regulatory subunit A
MLHLTLIIDKPATNEHILPVFLNLLRDENSEVRLNLFKRLHDLNEVIGIEELQ